MSRRNEPGLGALPLAFNDTADPDPHGQLTVWDALGDEEPAADGEVSQ